jgi:hypothetical protein
MKKINCEFFNYRTWIVFDSAKTRVHVLDLYDTTIQIDNLINGVSDSIFKNFNTSFNDKNGKR